MNNAPLTDDQCIAIATRIMLDGVNVLIWPMLKLLKEYGAEVTFNVEQFSTDGKISDDGNRAEIARMRNVVRVALSDIEDTLPAGSPELLALVRASTEPRQVPLSPAEAPGACTDEFLMDMAESLKGWGK